MRKTSRLYIDRQLGGVNRCVRHHDGASSLCSKSPYRDRPTGPGLTEISSSAHLQSLMYTLFQFNRIKSSESLYNIVLVSRQRSNGTTRNIHCQVICTRCCV